MNDQIETINIVLTKGGFFYSLISFDRKDEESAKSKYIELIKASIDYELEEEDIKSLLSEDSYEIDCENQIQLVKSSKLI